MRKKLHIFIIIMIAIMNMKDEYTHILINNFNAFCKAAAVYF